MFFGGGHAQAFPNVGISLKNAIVNHAKEAEPRKDMNTFKFGVMGSFEFKTVDHRFERDWKGVLTRIVDESEMYERCTAGAADCPEHVRKWRVLLEDLKGLPQEVQVKRLNKAINGMISYADDDKLFGKRDYWASPAEVLHGRGDCEDYSALKFWSLLELGFRNDQLRMVVVRDRRRALMHAVTTVQLDDGRTLVLDSLFDHPVEPQHILKYEPIYSANLNTQWGHIVTKKIRLSFLNQIEKRTKPQVIKVSAQEPAPEAVDEGGASFESEDGASLENEGGASFEDERASQIIRVSEGG
ncbi:MAG: transglutaminase-like cysteine peptidase [Pseudomonadota bacterium]